MVHQRRLVVHVSRSGGQPKQRLANLLRPMKFSPLERIPNHLKNKNRGGRSKIAYMFSNVAPSANPLISIEILIAPPGVSIGAATPDRTGHMIIEIQIDPLFVEFGSNCTEDLKKQLACVLLQDSWGNGNEDRVLLYCNLVVDSLNCGSLAKTSANTELPSSPNAISNDSRSVLSPPLSSISSNISIAKVRRIEFRTRPLIFDTMASMDEYCRPSGTTACWCLGQLLPA
jgi:hypothetical protein